MNIFNNFKNKYDVKNLNKLFLNKNILVFDLETTGFPSGGSTIYCEDYDKYKNNDNFKNARIIQIGWSYTKNWQGKFDIKKVKCRYRKSRDIKEIKNSHIHNITIDILDKEGEKLSVIFKDSGFGYAITNADYIVAHNANFDISILLNELHRLNYNRKLNKILDLIKNKKIICTLKYAKAVYAKSYSLSNFYKYYYDVEPELVHRADEDVKILLLILNKLVNDEKIVRKYDKNEIKFIKFDENGEDVNVTNKIVKYYYPFCISFDATKNNIQTAKKYLYLLEDEIYVRNIYSSISNEDIFYYNCTLASRNDISDSLEKFGRKYENKINFNYLKVSSNIFTIWEEYLCNGMVSKTKKRADFIKDKKYVKDDKYFNNGNPWNDKNSNELINAAKTCELVDIIKLTGRTEGSIKSQLKRLIQRNKINLDSIKSHRIRNKISKTKERTDFII